MHARLRGSKRLLTLYQIIIKTDFPSLAGEIAEPRPYMNIKVAAFTVSEKSNYMGLCWDKALDRKQIQAKTFVPAIALPQIYIFSC